MSAETLKETFGEPNINENLELEEGFLDEQASSMIKQILSKQLSKFAKKGQLKLSSSTLGLLKKLHGLGVKQMYGYDLAKAIPALERELAVDAEDEDDVATLLKKLVGRRPIQSVPGQRYPIRKGGRIVRWATKKEASEVRYSLKRLFQEDFEGNHINLVETELQTRYANENEKPAYSTEEDQKPLPQNEVPETPIQDDADDSPPLSDDDVIGALTQDNAHYGEYDNALEDK